ncbi:MAG: radical SAM family heme chaperone HemW [Prevotella sp.]|nr:radical SAM family heme chaperone HemW [Prevotella sp.]
MSGLYIHIPFCSSRCIYCGFYSTTRLSDRQRYVDVLCQELRQRCNEAEDIGTVYLGGGTPSLLSGGQLNQLFGQIADAFDIAAGTEITIECNPDDVTAEFVRILASLPVNRISMGAQTFSDQRLAFLGRRHRARQVGQAMELLHHAGITNVSVDLIYGFPDESMDDWKRDIDEVLGLEATHLSAYALSYEEGTRLRQMLDDGRVKELEDELQRDMYYYLKDRLLASDYDHYEISNFAQPGYRSRHNSNYWNHTPYLGIGAGAHSLTVREGVFTRQWNVENLTAYMTGIENGHPEVGVEELDGQTWYNEQIMTALRTSEGLNLNDLDSTMRTYCMRQARKYISSGWLTHRGTRLVLTREGLFVSDRVMSDLMLV